MKGFIEGPFRRDLKNMALYFWTMALRDTDWGESNTEKLAQDAISITAAMQINAFNKLICKAQSEGFLQDRMSKDFKYFLKKSQDT